VINLTYLAALLLTLIVESLVAFLFGYRNRRDISCVILVSLVTNPILNFIFLSNNYFAFLTVNSWTIFAMESMVVLSEWLMLSYVLRDKPKKLLLLSITMNACSYLAGAVLLG